MKKGDAVMKRFFALVVCLLCLFCMTVSSFAYPPSVIPYDYGTSSSLLVIKKPEVQNSASTKKVYPLSGVSASSSVITVYTYDEQSGVYVPMKNSEGVVLSSTVGYSGLFGFNVTLNEGVNKLMVRADYIDGSCQNVYITIKLLDTVWVNNIRSIVRGFSLGL